jgi:hypothetical protein
VANLVDQNESRYRFIQDQVITRQQCEALMQLVDSYGQLGDGYNGNAHPHSPTEVFGGYSFYGNTDSPQPCVPGHRDALVVMRTVQSLLKAHFDLPFLWLDYGQLVFRYPTGEPADGQTDDDSHPWHYDNRSETLEQRTHTAIVYLNDEFDGGLTRFKETDIGPYREVEPVAGRMVAFDVANNAHGVTRLNSGKRYVLNLWFSTYGRIYPRHHQIFSALFA